MPIISKYNIFVSFYILYNIDVIFCLLDVLTYLIKTYTWSCRGKRMWKLKKPLHMFELLYLYTGVFNLCLHIDISYSKNAYTLS
jgi:hypothetical protein